jgi:hypothetical protein
MSDCWHKNFQGSASDGSPCVDNECFLYIIWPADGDCPRGVLVPLRSSQHGCPQAGSNAPNSGHRHLLIESLDPNEPIPQDKVHLHFSAGQTESHLELRGKHTLQLVLGDAKHFPFNPPVISKKITIAVK